MTLRLVSENPEPVIAIQFAEQARKFADALEAGEYGEVERIALVVEYDGGLTTEAWGARVNPYDLMGLFEGAKLFTFADSVDDE